MLQEQQKEKIEDLKQSTNFYSTKALLERFDSSYPQPEKQSQRGKSSGLPNSDPAKRQQGLRNRKQHSQNSTGGNSRPSSKRNSMIAPENFEFAPDLPSLQQKPQPTTESAAANSNIPIDPSTSLPNINNPSLAPIHNVGYQPRWYDRILDMIVGEDEYSPKYRYALICEKCHRHNGLALPGESPQYVVYFCPGCNHRNGTKKPKKRTKQQSHSESIDLASNSNNDGTKPLKFDTSVLHTQNDDSSEYTSEEEEHDLTKDQNEEGGAVHDHMKEKPNKHKRHHSIAEESTTTTVRRRKGKTNKQ